MRFVSLEVESFRAVRRARVSFGPGLNIVYGPNDLGKSTLAAAIQAALLVMTNSSEAASYTPWYADATPKVTLVFTDDKGLYWKVFKAFAGDETAELFSSKDGKTFALDCKQRAVDGKLRELLGWGIAAPGGKGAPRGLPESFLSQVLLAPQTDVDAILGKSLADDTATTGQLRLNKALATLAQDPLFKRVLDQAQAEVDKLFTPTGRPKKSSELAAASEVIKKVQAELVQMENDLQSSKLVEDDVNRLREAHAQALQRLSLAEASRDDVRRRLAALAVRAEAQAKIDVAQAEVNRHDAAAQEVARLAAEVGRLEEVARLREQTVAQAQTQKGAAERAVREAEEQLRAAQSEDGARQRALQQAQLEKQAAELRAQLQQAKAQQEKIEAALASAQAAEKAQAASKTAADAAAKARKAATVAQGEVPAADQEVALSRAVLAYGRWRVASTRAAEAAKTAETARATRADAEAKAQQALVLAESLAARRAKLHSQQALLPDEKTLRALVDLDRKLAVAEAALGGGLSVAVRARGQSVVKAAVDGEKAAELPAEAVVEAQRSIKLSVGKNVDLEVTAGSPESRRAVERLRAEWLASGAPSLEKAQVESLAALSKLAHEAAQEKQALAMQEKELERLRGEAQSLAAQALQLEQQGGGLAVDPEELLRMKALFGAAEEKILAGAFAKLGKSWESQVEELIASATRKQQTAQDELAKAQQAAQLAEYKAAEALKAQGEAQAKAAAQLAAAGGGEPEKSLQAAKEACEQLSRLEQETQTALRFQEEGSTQEGARAEKGVAAAMAALAAAEAQAAVAAQALDEARAAFNKRGGEHAQAAAQLARLDRAGAAVSLLSARDRLAALPKGSPATQADSSSAEAAVSAQGLALEQAKQALHTAEGALTKVGGASLADEAERLRDALNAARARERELSVDASAWKLVLETLRLVENEEGAHLGRALAGPVAKRFGELTAGRYQGVRLDTALKTEGLSVAGANTGDADVVHALSVGTRDQLATLVRLTIAEQLKTAILLDDQLVHTDGRRLKWFVEAFLKTALESQVIVLTCQPEGYLEAGDLAPRSETSWDVAAGRVRVVDAGRVVERFGNQSRT